MTELTREPLRPEPEPFSPKPRAKGRGRLKVYLGMAPGVGKTFAMLEGARRLKAQNVDVVVGLVETHGRADTEAMLEGFEILPRKAVPTTAKRCTNSISTQRWRAVRKS